MKFKNLFCSQTISDAVFIRNLYGDEINQHNARSCWLCKRCGKMIYKSQLFDIGNYSDGYHTFNELYHHRAILFSVICNCYKEKCWKSLLHEDGQMYDGLFIVGIETPEGTATYHYDIHPYWNLFDVKILPKAPSWDGHTPDDAINRIKSLLKVAPKPKVVERRIIVNTPPNFKIKKPAATKDKNTTKKKKFFGL